MKSKTILILFVLLFMARGFSQEMQSGYFVAQSPALTEESRLLLENKIAVSLSEAGVTSTDQYYPVVTCVKYDEVETIENTGIRTVYKTVGNVTILIMLEKSSKLLSAKAFKVEGSGTTKEIAQNNAINGVEISSDDLKELFAKNKTAIKNEVSKIKTKSVTSKKTEKVTKTDVAKKDDKTKAAAGKKADTEKTPPTTGGDLSTAMKQSRSDVNKSYQTLFNKLFKK